MTKAILIALNLFFILIYKLFLGGDLSIEQKMPEKINAGESFTLEIIIDKGDREGFAKWQQSIPQGFIVKAKETEGATFSFKNQEIKVIWMSIPKNETFTISFDIETSPNLSGAFEFKGQFSYIEDNQRKDISSDARKIQVITSKAITLEDAPSNEEDAAASVEAQNEVEVAEEITDKNNQTDDVYVAKEGVSEQDGIKITRTIKPLEDAKYEVTLSIDKSTINSFGKIEEYLPPNHVASELENGGAMFSYNRNIAKFLWMVLPEKDLLTISYIMESTSDELDESQVHGVFSYLKEDVPMQMKINPTLFENTYVAPEEIVVDDVEEDEKVSDISTEVVVLEETEAITAEAVDAVEEEVIAEAIVSEKDQVKEITNIPAPETNIAYKVQIAAGKKEVNQQYFVTRHGIKETVNIEYHDTWYKYTIGSYPLYKEARDRRNEIWAAENKINDAFVTAYNSGERISVQEALMISQQKWYK